MDGTVYEVQFDDWMYLMDGRVMLNKAVMRKFGIRLEDCFHMTSSGPAWFSTPPPSIDQPFG